jgi:hypothetical protein
MDRGNVVFFFSYAPSHRTSSVVKGSIADPGCLLRIRDVYPGSRIPDPKTAIIERSEKKLVIPFFVAINFTK